MPNENDEIELPQGEPERESNRTPRRGQRPAGPSEVGVLEFPDARHDLGTMILSDAIRREVEVALHRFLVADQLEAVWGLSRIEPNAGRCVLNFYGPPGTGKTITAGAIARRLNRPLFRVDYSAVVSKYLGDTAKHIVRAFRTAAEEGAVLFFDEADSLVSKRVASGESCSTSINQNRNTLMAELDRFNGVAILTTNLFQNYDPAMLRRSSRHVEFRLPDWQQREALLRLHLPNGDRVAADLRTLAMASRGLSGGDIRNVCLNAIYAASMDPDPAQWIVRDAHLRAEIVAIQDSKRAHAPVGTPELTLEDN
jgi:SpoVK/Ycf46/Vps4 family AAA+-type ATPase